MSTEPATVFVRGTGGTIFEMDVPTGVHTRELFDGKLAKGELTLIENPCEWVERPDGSRFVREVAPVEVDAEPSKRGRKAPVEVDAEPSKG